MGMLHLAIRLWHTGADIHECFIPTQLIAQGHSTKERAPCIGTDRGGPLHNGSDGKS